VAHARLARDISSRTDFNGKRQLRLAARTAALLARYWREPGKSGGFVPETPRRVNPRYRHLLAGKQVAAARPLPQPREWKTGILRTVTFFERISYSVATNVVSRTVSGKGRAMIRVRRSHERGHANHGWLNSDHTFSFAGYHDPNQMGFRSLRVMNEDRVAPGQGFGEHPHSDMEIVSYVLEGALQHRDSMGNGSVLHAGDFQRITAGTGVEHSEFNPSTTEAVHFYQIWLFPDERGLEPSYEERSFSPNEKHNQLRLVARWS
jgi:hypothetical protein